MLYLHAVNGECIKRTSCLWKLWESFRGEKPHEQLSVSCKLESIVKAFFGSQIIEKNVLNSSLPSDVV